MLQWNVYIGGFNSRKIEIINIFDHVGFLDDCRKNAKKNNKDREAFVERLRGDLMYHFWSKCEWEIIIDHWPHNDHFEDKKVDVYNQVNLNWDIFSDYVWNNRSQFRRKEESR